jgi:hypothetical protein
MTTLKLLPDEDDDTFFINLVQQTISGSINSSSLEHYAVIKIKNWFDDKWLGFGGVRRDYSGLLSFEPGLPVRYRFGKSLPPFPKSRIVYCNSYGRPNENPAGVYYFSGNSKSNGRASLLASIPGSGERWDWYVGYSGTPEWHAIRHKNVSANEIESWTKQGC